MSTLSMYRLNKAVYKPAGVGGFISRSKTFESTPMNTHGVMVSSMTRGFHYRIVITAESRTQRADLEAYVLRAAVMHYFKVHEVTRSVAYGPEGQILLTCEITVGAYIRPDFGPYMYGYDRNHPNGALRFVALMDDALGDIEPQMRDEFYDLPCVLSVDSAAVGSVVAQLRKSTTTPSFV